MGLGKVQVFWEDHKNLELSSTYFDIYLANQLICQNKWKITSNFCDLLRKAELYKSVVCFLWVVLHSPQRALAYDFSTYSFISMELASVLLPEISGRFERRLFNVLLIKSSKTQYIMAQPKTTIKKIRRQKPIISPLLMMQWKLFFSHL